MKTAVILLLTILGISPAGAQVAPATPANVPAGGSTSMTSVLPELDRLQSTASEANLTIGKLRIEKWKVDSDSKRQAQTNADSIQRNLTAALPGLITDVRSNPQSLSAEFKLYRNLVALYDVFASLTESTGAFGPKSDYDTLSQQLSVVDSVRQNLGNSLEGLTASTQSDLDQLRLQVRTMQQAAAAAPPKKVVVDDSEPVKKTTKKKKSASTGSGSPASSNSGTTATTSKSQ